MSIRQTTLHRPGNVQPTESVRWLAAACIVTDQKRTKVFSLHHTRVIASYEDLSGGIPFQQPARSQNEVFWAIRLLLPSYPHQPSQVASRASAVQPLWSAQAYLMGVPALARSRRQSHRAEPPATEC
jgi:hypothetical protein